MMNAINNQVLIEVKDLHSAFGSTISVVNALFWIIFLDAVFSIIFSKLNI